MVVLLGPAWSTEAAPLIDQGRFPLGVESATLSNARRLAPLVNSGTAHARYYLLHAVVASGFPAALGETDALAAGRDRVRRAEVVLAAASLRHAAAHPDEHAAPLPYRDPHGTRVIAERLGSGLIDVPSSAAEYSSQTGGFLSVYRGAEIEAGLLDSANGTLLPGSVALPESELAAVRSLITWAAEDQLSTDQLDQVLPGACLCQVRSGNERDLLSAILFGTDGDLVPAPRAVQQARARTAATARLVLHAHDGQDPYIGTRLAMTQLCYTSERLAQLSDPRLLDWALSWRGALLRNASVTAWRWLWWWLTECLAEKPRSREALGEALAEALVASAGHDGNVVKSLTTDLPPHREGDCIRDVEGDLLYPNGAESDDPWAYVQVLALGARRLPELTGPELRSFTEFGELGPSYVRNLLENAGRLSVAEFGRDLVDRLLRQAMEISHRRVRWEAGRLRIPTRLREVGEVLDLAGTEGSVAPGLRLERMRQILEELGYLTLDNDALAVRRWIE
ncbi:hypothetical protein [Actinoplanes couchii]|uniref:hypothetical protein n=1 Tax=Actinoplanes couchii TaxID=403638 RepID=UPI0019446C65|nr:hypothetical protein [Actinoplanes couchii]MDR6320047.1 hypothetical protein [Actinoplanes couchii]